MLLLRSLTIKHGHKIIEQTFEIDPPPNKGYNLRGY